MEMMGGRENMFDHTSGRDLMSPERYGTGEVQSRHPSAMIWAIWRTVPQVHVDEMPFIRSYKFRTA